MVRAILKPEEAETLQAFVEDSRPGAPYLRRARIVLLANDGQTHEAIAAELEVPILHVRHFLQAFRRQGLQLFPRNAIPEGAAFSADESITEASRKIMAGLLANVLPYKAALEAEASVTSVHETRKAIRELRTALRLFEPYFEEGVLRRYRKRFRKVMRRLARPRDLAVFLQKLEAYTAAEASDAQREGLGRLAAYWREQLVETEEKVRAYLAKGKYQKLLADFQTFTATPGMGSLAPGTPDQTVRRLAPVHIRRQLADVKSCGEEMDGATPAELHELRIQTKELRYTLGFYQPVLGPQAAAAIETVKTLLIHLGGLNDARVHLSLLEQLDDPELEPAITSYRRFLAADLEKFVEHLPDLWEPLTQGSWQEQVDQAIAVL